jgi:peptidoglycan/LPS O-acetylase OafA/YrhL
LVFVTLGGALVALWAHGWRDLLENPSIYAIWFLSQTTLGQFYNPAHFRDVGVGVINGSLWTLTTEILFYFCVPAIAWLERRFRYTVVALTGFSFAIYSVGATVWVDTVYRDKTLFDVFALTPIVWGWMFGLGILSVKHFEHLKNWLPYLPLLVVPLIVMLHFGDGVLFGSDGNRLGLFYFACYVGLAIWLAFGTPFVRLNIDLSYGTYVWHMPVINLLLVLAFPSAVTAVVLTFAMAAFSWFAVEKPALRRKRQSLKQSLPTQGGAS